MSAMSERQKKRSFGRGEDGMRPVRIELGAMKFADGSARIEMGDTHVLVAATVDHRVPPFLIDSGKGWATAEYAMLPRSTSRRSGREVKKGRQSGRSAEIQRLIGRSLRAALDLKAMPGITLTIDCDVIQADGGTRTASITGAYVAACHALAGSLLAGDIPRWPIRDQVAAISVGVVGGRPMLDLDAPEDQSADVDMNVVASTGGALIEVQGTAEGATFSRAELDRLLDLAMGGIVDLGRAQDAALAGVMAEVESASGRERGRPAEPKDEGSLWGKP